MSCGTSSASQSEFFQHTDGCELHLAPPNSKPLFSHSTPPNTNSSPPPPPPPPPNSQTPNIPRPATQLTRSPPQPRTPHNPPQSPPPQPLTPHKVTHNPPEPPPQIPPVSLDPQPTGFPQRSSGALDRAGEPGPRGPAGDGRLGPRIKRAGEKSSTHGSGRKERSLGMGCFLLFTTTLRCMFCFHHCPQVHVFFSSPLPASAWFLI